MEPMLGIKYISGGIFTKESIAWEVITQHVFISVEDFHPIARILPVGGRTMLKDTLQNAMQQPNVPCGSHCMGYGMCKFDIMCANRCRWPGGSAI